MKKIIKNTLIPGIIGSIIATALYEKVSMLFTFLYLIISSTIDKTITTFSNNTYKKIATGTNDLSFIIYIVFFAIIISYIFHLIQVKFFKKNNVPGIVPISTIKLEHRNKLLFKLVVALISILFILVCAYFIGNYIFINECQTNSLCNLEIISPYISDIEYKKLKSTFYSIQTKQDYESFISTINKIGTEYSITLRK